MNTILVFDLDNTLYPYQSGLFAHINARMNHFIADHLHLSLSEVDQIRTRYIQQYGTTQEGLTKEHGLSPIEFLSYAHDISIEKFLHPDPVFRDFLKELPNQKYIFSNSPIVAIKRILEHLQIDSFFTELISIETFDYIGKPNRSAFNILTQHLPCGYRKALLFDDEPKNIATGNEFGFFSVFVNGKSIPPDDYYVPYLIPLIKENL